MKLTFPKSNFVFRRHRGSCLWIPHQRKSAVIIIPFHLRSCHDLTRGSTFFCLGRKRFWKLPAAPLWSWLLQVIEFWCPISLNSSQLSLAPIFSLIAHGQKRLLWGALWGVKDQSGGEEKLNKAAKSIWTGSDKTVWMLLLSLDWVSFIDQETWWRSQVILLLTINYRKLPSINRHKRVIWGHTVIEPCG